MLNYQRCQHVKQSKGNINKPNMSKRKQINDFDVFWYVTTLHFGADAKRQFRNGVCCLRAASSSWHQKSMR